MTLPRSGMVRLDDVWTALNVCLEGYRVEEKLHHWWVFGPGDHPPYRSVPKGPHGARKRVKIEVGHVRSLARHFGVLPCMEEQM